MDYLKEPQLVAKIQNFFGVKTNFIDTNVNSDLHKMSSGHSKEYILTNKYWYYLFIFGTALGDETFYSAFIPFWFWNIDGAVGRRVVLVWAIVMYVGQGIKDIIRWPRPGPPVVRLQNKWALEYGMPSTHAMVGVSIPFSVLLYTMNRYQYNVPLGLCIAILWCTVICISRLYLGMHTVLDIIAGLALAVVIMFPLVPLVDQLDDYFLTIPTAPFLLLVSSILMIVYYPNSGKWTPTRGDTTMILSVCVGIHIGAWLNYQTGLMTPSELTAPYVIMWPSYTMLGCMVLRTILGFACVILTRIVCKSATYHFLCALLKEDVDVLKKSENTLQNKHKTIVELGCKYVYCAMIGFNTLYLLPQLFRYLRIERPTFFTEI
ncbi:sphingosine-1-phosphate phosphatase 2-like [Anoplophora glabripennis]|uniref:sphingosine-1-phosphate phosphatase 2-like n=1 Tax=Anoplophora glabripennis TaxID=217634 RepID=UPI000873E53A|nr:sphingosine-1-phosphate phosphatase 2-like [Anoplophora glabripennis]